MTEDVACCYTVPGCVIVIDILLTSRVSHWLADPWNEGHYGGKGQVEIIPFQVELSLPPLLG